MSTILFIPDSAWGQINPCIGIGIELVGRGHRVVFAVESAFSGQLKSYGFDVELITTEAEENNNNNNKEEVEDNNKVADKVVTKNSREYWPDFMAKNSRVFEYEDSVDVFCNFIAKGSETEHLYNKVSEQQLLLIIDQLVPDIILVDSLLQWKLPDIQQWHQQQQQRCQQSPWVLLHFPGPIYFYSSPLLPPVGSGYPTISSMTTAADSTNHHRKLWQQFTDRFAAAMQQTADTDGDGDSDGTDRAVQLAEQEPLVPPKSPYLNVYMCVEELDYPEVHPLPDPAIYLRVENIMRPMAAEVLTADAAADFLPKQLLDNGLAGDEKLVFITMGTIVCHHLKLMNRLVRVFSQSRHRFIIKTGPYDGQLALGSNMWGQSSIDPRSVLPIVDLVVTHGGNNTVTETCYYGKPMLVLPVFGDQFDIAQRVQESGLGLRLNAFHSSADELIGAVDRLVNDVDLRQRMQQIGDRIRQRDDKKLLADLIEKILVK